MCILDHLPSAVVFIAILTILLRVSYVLYLTGKPSSKQREDPARTLVILGSGGHTAEMLNLLSVLHLSMFAPRFYVAAMTDTMSLQKARVFEDSLLHTVKDTTNRVQQPQYMQIYRSREVGQSYITSIWTTLIAIAHAFWLTLWIRPEVVICNGPGTCIPLCASAFFFKIIGIRWSYIFYVESIARVQRLSLSGLLLYKLHLADQLFVQWPQLVSKYPKAQYVGRLM